MHKFAEAAVTADATMHKAMRKDIGSGRNSGHNTTSSSLSELIILAPHCLCEIFLITMDHLFS
jgi:hypothetical protein